MTQYTLAELEAMPTLCTSQADDLKVETNHTRIWLSRCSIEDGEPFNNKVTVERYHYELGWHEVETYEAL